MSMIVLIRRCLFLFSLATGLLLVGGCSSGDEPGALGTQPADENAQGDTAPNDTDLEDEDPDSLTNPSNPDDGSTDPVDDAEEETEPGGDDLSDPTSDGEPNDEQDVDSDPSDDSATDSDPLDPVDQPEETDTTNPDDEDGANDSAAPEESGLQRVIYWGQNGYGSTDPNSNNWERPLGETCESGDYDVVVLGFVPWYFDTRNPGDLPGMNFSFHCETAFDGYVSLLHCPQIAQDIETCQSLGVKTLMSLGGAVGTYTFTDNTQAREFAHTVWDMFLGGSDENLPRPFDDVVLDGVDLDIEAGGVNYHSAFVDELHGLMDSGTRDYIVAAAPQCPMPDANLGPVPGSALGDHPDKFDHLYIQFYNNYCRYNHADPTWFNSVFDEWMSWSVSNNGPEIFVGLPAAPSAAPAGGFVERDDLQGLVDYVTPYERFGGFMLWDASFDQQSEENGQTYFQYLMSLVGQTQSDESDVPADTTGSDDSGQTGDTSPTTGCSPGVQDLGNVSIELTSTSQWETGQSVSAVLTNTSTTSLTELQLVVENPAAILSLWGLDGTPSLYTLPSWLTQIAPGETYSFGMTAAPNELPCFAQLGTIPDAGDSGGDSSTGTNDDSVTDDSPDSDLDTPSVTPLEDKKIVAYFVEWGVYQRDYHVADIPAEKITHINYAFANVSDGGECILYDSYAAIDKFYPGDSWDSGAMRGNFNQLRLLKEAHPHLKTLISIGGWTLSSKFPEVAATAQSREKFARSCVEFMQMYGFDGIDVDWEYPVSGGLTDGTPEDKENFTLLLAALREELDDAGAGYLLTIAAPAGSSTYPNLELDLIHPYLDFINVMTYDFHGGWENQTGHNAAMYPTEGDPSEIAQTGNVNAAIEAYLDAGIPPAKVVMGLPFYGRGWQDVSATANGRFQSASGAAANGTWEPGIFDYKDLKNNFVGQGYTRYWDDDAMVPYLYNPSTGIWISYDDVESMTIKTQYIVSQGLGGAMYWELSSDTADAELLSVVYEGFLE